MAEPEDHFHFGIWKIFVSCYIRRWELSSVCNGDCKLPRLFFIILLFFFFSFFFSFHHLPRPTNRSVRHSQQESLKSPPEMKSQLQWKQKFVRPLFLRWPKKGHCDAFRKFWLCVRFKLPFKKSYSCV